LIEAERLGLTADATWDEEDVFAVFKRLEQYLPEASTIHDLKSAAAAEMSDLLDVVSRQQTRKKESQDGPTVECRDYRKLPKVLRPDSVVFVDAADKYLTDDDFARTVPPGGKSFIRSMFIVSNRMMPD
jgi:hypothetical protein